MLTHIRPQPVHLTTANNVIVVEDKCAGQWPIFTSVSPAKERSSLLHYVSAIECGVAPSTSFRTSPMLSELSSREDVPHHDTGSIPCSRKVTNISHGALRSPSVCVFAVDCVNTIDVEAPSSLLRLGITGEPSASSPMSSNQTRSSLPGN
jgi:hypothetical protein